jgi:hypothetical protein
MSKLVDALFLARNVISVVCFVGSGKDSENMKMALDVWYELWEQSRSKGDFCPDQPSEEEHNKTWEESKQASIREKELSSTDH